MTTTAAAVPDAVLDDIDDLVLSLFDLVAQGLARATAAFLGHDRDAARALVAGDTEFDTLGAEIEETVEAELRQGAIGARLARLLAVVRIVPELERSGDLVEHIALRSAHGLTDQLTPRSRELIAAMGAVGVELWRGARQAYATRDPSAAIRLRTRDDELDDLHVQLTSAITEDAAPTAAAIELGLIARFYERLGDHAVNVARRVPAAV